MSDIKKTHPRISWTFDEYTNSEIRRAAETGIYDIRGGGSKRKLPHFDDLLFLGASMSRYPLEGYRETCNTKVTLGTRYASKPLELDIPITLRFSLRFFAIKFFLQLIHFRVNWILLLIEFSHLRFNYSR